MRLLRGAVMEWLKKLEAKDILTIIALLLTLGAAKSRLEAVERAVEPVPQMRTDIEVVKAGMITMSAAIATLADEQRRASRAEGRRNGQ